MHKEHYDMNPCVPDLHDAQAIFCSNFVLHSINVVLHCLFREAKAIRDLLILEPLGDQWNQSVNPVLRCTVAEGKELASLSLEIPEQSSA